MSVQVKTENGWRGDTVSVQQKTESGWVEVASNAPKMAKGDYTTDTTHSKYVYLGFKPKRIMWMLRDDTGASTGIHTFSIVYDESIDANKQFIGYASEAASWQPFPNSGALRIISIDDNGFTAGPSHDALFTRVNWFATT